MCAIIVLRGSQQSREAASLTQKNTIMTDYIIDNHIHVYDRTGNYMCGWFGTEAQASPTWFIMNREGKVLHCGRRNYIVSEFNRRYNYRSPLWVKAQIEKGKKEVHDELNTLLASFNFYGV